MNKGTPAAPSASFFGRSSSELDRISSTPGLAQDSSTGASTCGIDNDTLCSYSTNKVVVIRSWKLGLLSNIIRLGVLGYIAYSIYYQQGYMLLEQVEDTGVRASLYSQTSVHDLPEYCCECDQSTGLPLKPYAKNDANYDRGYHACQAVGGAPGACCAVSDKEGVRLVSATSASTLTVATNYEFLDFESSCASQGANRGVIYPVSADCSIRTLKSEHNFYTMGIEDFTLGVMNSLSAPKSVLDAPIPLNMMAGELRSVDGELLRSWPSQEPVANMSQGTDRVMDIMTLGEVFRATGLNLSAGSDHDPRYPSRTFRDTGVVIIMKIEYLQRSSTPTNRHGMKYIYKPQLVPSVKFMDMRDISPPRGGRQVQDFAYHAIEMHGIRLNFYESGTIGVFDVTALFVSLAAAMTMLSLAGILTDLIMVYMSRAGKYYEDFKFENSIDFSEVRGREDQFKLPSITPFAMTQYMEALKKDNDRMSDRIQVLERKLGLDSTESKITTVGYF